jgi:UDP-GlcNAc3NAcA epimerase
MPEEINRILTDHVSTYLLTPTESANKNLKKEGISEEKIFMVGDVMLDASNYYINKCKKPSFANSLKIENNKFILATIHRAENTDDPIRLNNIFKGLATSLIPVVIPIHPRTKSRIKEFGIKLASHLHLTEPVGYLEMVWLESNCKLICTDSGGVQKEAFFFGKLCLTMRDETEWVELVDEGWNKLVGTDPKIISESLWECTTPEVQKNLYGNGTASIKIVDILTK